MKKSPLPRRAQIAKDFNAKVNELIRKLESKLDDEADLCSVDRLRSRIVTVNNWTGPETAIGEAAPYFIKYSEQIINWEEEFITGHRGRDALAAERLCRDSERGHRGDDQLATELFDIIARHYPRATPAEKQDVRQGVTSMLGLCVEFLSPAF